VAADSLVYLLGRGAPRAPDRDALEAWGRALGAVLPRPVVITLEGDLGAGKTTLVRAICVGIGVLMRFATCCDPSSKLIRAPVERVHQLNARVSEVSRVARGDG
jgi:tRNA threonylcarbamoyladenosine biosynthesis protein TsaE